MKISTYNIWSSQAGMPRRKTQIINELKALDSDVIALQEVWDEAFVETVCRETGHAHHRFAGMGDKSFGLALLSKHPITHYEYAEHALFVRLDHEGASILLVNVHLPDASVLAQEHSIMAISERIKGMKADYRFILGDFNCSENSSVHQFLLGARSLYGTEADRYWTDLASVAEEFLGVKKENTLDLSNNPRWKGRPLTDTSARVDTVFFHDCFPNPYPVLKEYRYFGKAVDAHSGYSASDHYGVLIDLEMPEAKK